MQANAGETIKALVVPISEPLDSLAPLRHADRCMAAIRDAAAQAELTSVGKMFTTLARIIGPIVAGALFSGLGHDWPFLVGAMLTIPAAVMAINAGAALRRQSAAV